MPITMQPFYDLEELPTWPKSEPAPLQFVVVILEDEEVSEVVGPFDSVTASHEWVDHAKERDHTDRLYYVLSFIPPTR